MTASVLNHLFEPTRLLVTWQPVDERAQDRTRRIVGEVTRSPDAPDDWRFRYLVDSNDFQAALKAGFRDYPAFDIKQETFHQGVQDSLLRRLPPRKREDFPEYLAQHRLPSPFTHSDMALLGYTGGKLPSDGFSFLPDFSTATMPCDFILEVAGTRYALSESGLDTLPAVGAETQWQLRAETDNPKDPKALAVYADAQKIGYLPRPYAAVVSDWMNTRRVSIAFERTNGKPARPLVYLRLMAYPQ
jgi:HIRAN domain